jgi:hypothetical protein
LIVVVYVDDLVIIGNNIDLILTLKRKLFDTFDMTYLGLLHYFLGLQDLPLFDGLFLSQSKYVLDILNRFKMAHCKPYSTPFQSGINITREFKSPKVDATFYWQSFGSFIYITHIRPDLSFVFQNLEEPQCYWFFVNISDPQ